MLVWLVSTARRAPEHYRFAVVEKENAASTWVLAGARAKV